jgi:hypothetical protein
MDTQGTANKKNLGARGKPVDSSMQEHIAGPESALPPVYIT